jgi:hypothetical protein
MSQPDCPKRSSSRRSPSSAKRIEDIEDESDKLRGHLCVVATP